MRLTWPSEDKLPSTNETRELMSSKAAIPTTSHREVS